jgi:DNA modification methylase
VGIDNEREYLDLSIKRFEELRNNLIRKQQNLFKEKTSSIEQQML